MVYPSRRVMRNSILLVDFINHETARGLPLAQAVEERPVPSPSACKVPCAPCMAEAGPIGAIDFCHSRPR